MPAPPPPLLRLYSPVPPAGPVLAVAPPDCSLRSERCVYVESRRVLSARQHGRLCWLLRQTATGAAQPTEVTDLHPPAGRHSFVFEIGPRLNFCTPLSTNAVAICHALGLSDVTRVEVARRYQLISDKPLSDVIKHKIISSCHDRLTECCYPAPLSSFGQPRPAEPWGVVDVLEHGRGALRDVNKKLGLAFDDWDLDFYSQLFTEKLRRNPTTVECFDLAQSNSEHSRHWFFKGSLVIDGTIMDKSLLDMVIETQKRSADNNVIKFSDNSSAIRGSRVTALRAVAPEKAAPLTASESSRHIVFTAETHNFPTGVSPFSGSTTGTGGRIRDVQAVGRGGHVIAGTAGYCVGQLLLPDYQLVWEDPKLVYPAQFASPRRILIEASDGASDYGNKFGEPVVSGFTRSFGLSTPAGRREWVKPIMFSGGIGSMEADMVEKMPPEKDMLVVKLGGPVYRIGVGGGAASSVQVQGDNADELDFGAVQRGDAEMEQKLNRVIRACIEAGEANPITSIHDQGAGGNGNVLKEIVEPAGAVIFTEEFQLGDPSISALELWGAEYQESNAILCRPESRPLLSAICRREKCPVSFVGKVTGDGRVTLREGPFDAPAPAESGSDKGDPVDLDLELILGKMPQKVFQCESPPNLGSHLRLPNGLRLQEALSRVLRLPSVASKRFLTNKVDRSVTGLVAQQQCVGPFHTPLADVAVVALSHYDTVGAATSIGEQPIKALLNPEAGARLSVAEAITNLVFAPVTSLKEVKCSANWMWPAKLPGEAAAIYSACAAMCDVMGQLGVAVDGGKDSLSMAARVSGSTVKAPGSLVVSAYVGCPDVRRVVTPDLKVGRGRLLYVGLGGAGGRLGGSALAQCYGQLGDAVPDLHQPELLVAAFGVTQDLINEGVIMSGHDVSDGGLIVCLLEMAIAGGRGLDLAWSSTDVITSGDVTDPLAVLLAEEPGWVLQLEERDAARAAELFAAAGVPCCSLGRVTEERTVTVRLDGELVLETELERVARDWEETSYRLELLQVTPSCAEAEWEEVGRRQLPSYWIPEQLQLPSGPPAPAPPGGPLVAVIREEGTNGDREMAAALDMAGFEVWDVTMTDLMSGGVTLDRFLGLVFPGGFSYADVLGSAVGWAASIQFEPRLSEQFEAFRRRTDTFSLGVCNGCQLMALLGWVGGVTQGAPVAGVNESKWKAHLTENESARFESRFSSVRVPPDCRSPLLLGLRSARLGVWSAHGQGRFELSGGPAHLERLRGDGLVAMEYVDDAGEVTERYPHNPNGSPGGVAGLCSPDGRHLAVMPHPERSALRWQWPVEPPTCAGDSSFAPWFHMFTSAYQWCTEPSDN
ncbi:phosphoribosylformylglycinamidine synthase-like [Amphibalanus amphitrite]|uniref:phosphoribosylformylglycinamidine synthase-like n=1 Tax=Amphibalanus amphitrite TaxID=1232801 RepID=UPI001C90961A|nr:phosphoribosylformylglycinamidine synthase-like [Amphibalanus amphitrite]